MRCVTWDESGCEVEIDAESAEAAAEAYVSGGDWGDGNGRTSWHRVWAVEIGEDGERVGDPVEHRVSRHPAEPDCKQPEHDWQAPYEVVGGIASNPGVWGEGGGVRIHECCVYCGCAKITRTWDQDPTTGEQGLRSVEYRPGEYDEAVRSWLEGQAESDAA